ncbi:hypothetical protein AB0E63_01265 [Kribbella sp. NPDC026596]|uniref:hypothetical protein n=1 Tax=Kribbella sp. NPDC026596 TaxID=3155122 RepID=UPI0033C686C5
MTSTPIVDDQPAPKALTANALLFGAGSAEALVQAIRERHATRTALRPIRRLSKSTAGQVDREVAAAIDGLLELDLGDVLTAAWQQHPKLIDAARRTLAITDAEEIVPLASHTIHATYSPHVDLAVKKTLVHCFKFVLEIVAELTALDAIVRSGKLAIRTGECTITATLTLDGARLATARHPAGLNLVVPLNPPRPLTKSSAAA